MRESKRRRLPEGWRWVSLGDTELMDIVMGQSPPGETYNKEKIGLPFYQGCADFGNINPEPTVWCSKPKKIAAPNDILLSVRAPVGPTNIAKEICCIGRGLAAMRCKEGLSHRYLIWVLRHFEKQISSEGAGSVFDAIGKDEIEDIEFPLPLTIDDQIAIASELERKMAEVDKMRRAALRQKEAIAAMQGAMSREVFPYKDGGKLPEGWRWEKLKKISTNIQYGISKSSSLDKLGPKLLRITDIQEGKVDWTNVPHCECNNNEEEKYLLEDGDIVFTRTGATTGKSFLLKTPEHALFASYLIRVQCDKQFVTPAYLYTFFQSPSYWYLITQESRGGTLAGFNATMLSEMEIPLPPTLDDQIAIASELERKMAEVNKIRQATDRQLEAIEALPGAILREVFDFEEKQITATENDRQITKERIQQCF